MVKSRKTPDERRLEKIKQALGKTESVTINMGGLKRTYPTPVFIDKISDPDSEIAGKVFWEDTELIVDVKPKHLKKKNDAKSAYNSVLRGLKGIYKSNKNTPKIHYGGETKKRWGDSLYSKSGIDQNSLINTLNKKKTEILGNAQSHSLIVNRAKKRDPKRYWKILDDAGIDRNASDDVKAQAINRFITNTTLEKGKSKPNGVYASSIIWDIAKESGWYDSHIGEINSYGSIQEKKLQEHFKTPASENQIKKIIRDEQYKSLKGKIGKTSPGWKTIQKVKNQKSWSKEELIKKINTDEGRQAIKNQIEYDVANGDMQKRVGETLLKKLRIGGEIQEKDIKLNKITKTKQKKLISNLYLGYSGKTTGVSKYLWEKLKGTDAMNALSRGDEEALMKHKPSSVDYNDMRKYFGKEPKFAEVKRLIEYNIDVNNLPPDIKEKLEKSNIKDKSKKSGGFFSKRSKSSSKKSSSKRSKYAYKDDDHLLGSKEIKWSGGKPKVIKHRGTISQKLHETKAKIPGVRSPEEKRRKIKEKQKDRKKLEEERFKEYDEDETYTYLTKEEKRYLAKTKNPIAKKNIEHKAVKMYNDPAYRAQQAAKKEERKGVYEAKLAKAQSDSRRRMKAATSPWWKAWYTLSHNIWILIGVILILSIAFIPVGMFYVLGWAMTVGVVALVSFIIWVFMELWFMIAQAIVALIGLVGQAITGAFNFIGNYVSDGIGYTFTQFKYQYVQDLRIPRAEDVMGYGYTWGEFNLVPPNFMKLDSFMPTEFDTNTILGHILPPVANFFKMVYAPIAERYTNWIATAEPLYVGTIIGIPVVLAVIGGVAIYHYYKKVKRRMI